MREYEPEEDMTQYSSPISQIEPRISSTIETTIYNFGKTELITNYSRNQRLREDNGKRKEEKPNLSMYFFINDNPLIVIGRNSNLLNY